MKRQKTGIYEITSIGDEQVRAFVPNPLPPEDALDIKYLQHSLDSAIFALGQLDSIATILPEPWLFIYAYVRREAVLSSRIEGTQSTLSDLMLFELTQASGTPVDDVVEVSNYVSALNTDSDVCEETNFRSVIVLSTRFIKNSYLLAEGAKIRLVNFGDLRTG